MFNLHTATKFGIRFQNTLFLIFLRKVVAKTKSANSPKIIINMPGSISIHLHLAFRMEIDFLCRLWMFTFVQRFLFWHLGYAKSVTAYDGNGLGIILQTYNHIFIIPFTTRPMWKLSKKLIYTQIFLCVLWTSYPEKVIVK